MIEAKNGIERWRWKRRREREVWTAGLESRERKERDGCFTPLQSLRFGSSCFSLSHLWASKHHIA